MTSPVVQARRCLFVGLAGLVGCSTDVPAATGPQFAQSVSAAPICRQANGVIAGLDPSDTFSYLTSARSAVTAEAASLRSLHVRAQDQHQLDLFVANLEDIDSALESFLTSANAGERADNAHHVTELVQLLALNDLRARELGLPCTSPFTPQDLDNLNNATG